MTDSGAEITTLGSGWRILHKEEMPSIRIGDPSSKMGQIHMHQDTGLTKVQSVNRGWVILRAANNALIYPEEIRGQEKETLFCLSQLRDHNIQVDDCPQKYGGAQCLVLRDEEDEEALIPLTYSKGISMLECTEPTLEKLQSLPVFDVIDPNGKWIAKALPPEDFDLQLCNQVLGLREQRRARMTNRKPGSLWNDSDIAMWQTRLGYASTHVTKKTLKATTQKAELEENNSSYTIMKDHFKKKFPGLGCRRVQDTVFCDLFQPSRHTCATKRGYYYYLLIAL